MKKIVLTSVLFLVQLNFTLSAAAHMSPRDAARAAEAKILAQSPQRPQGATLKQAAVLKQLAKTALAHHGAMVQSAAKFVGGPVTPFVSKGGLALVDAFAGVCFSDISTCNASQGDCFCEEFQGAGQTSTTGGLNNALFALTFNADDCVETGDFTSTDFFCCPFDGAIAFQNSTGKSAIAALVLGQWCQGDEAAVQLSGGMQIFGVAGSPVNALGTAQFNGIFLTGSGNPLQEFVNGIVQNGFF